MLYFETLHAITPKKKEITRHVVNFAWITLHFIYRECEFLIKYWLRPKNPLTFYESKKHIMKLCYMTYIYFHHHYRHHYGSFFYLIITFFCLACKVWKKLYTIHYFMMYWERKEKKFWCSNWRRAIESIDLLWGIKN